MRLYNDPVEISADIWAELLTDSEVTREPDLEVLKLVYKSRSHEMHAAEIALKLNLSHHAPLNSHRSYAHLPQKKLERILWLADVLRDGRSDNFPLRLVDGDVLLLLHCL